MINLIETTRTMPVVAILRAPRADRFQAASAVLVESGLKCLEFTLSTEGAVEAIRRVRAELPRDILVGAGTVRTPDQAVRAIDAGASFLVSPVYDPLLIDAAHERGVPFIPGAMTPSEIVAAWNHGVQTVKVSPIGPIGGIDYLREVSGPLPDVPLFPTGGVPSELVPDYLQAGAVLVGQSRHLIGDALLPGGDLSGLAVRATAVAHATRERGSA